MTPFPGQPLARVALYSHDGMGLGHIRRNLLIAQCLIAHRRETTILLISGAHEAGVLSLDPGLDCLTVPRLRKQTDGCYCSHSMNLDVADIIKLRTRVIGASLRAFDPDLFIVDKKVRGAFGELDPVLKSLRARGKTRVVLGLRDVLDDPEAVSWEWQRHSYDAAIRDYYDAVWVYGDRAAYDLGREARLPEGVSQRLEYTGYFDQRVRLAHARKSAPDILAELGVGDDPFVLCLVGGGEDGAHLAENFMRAELPSSMHGIVVTGPFMPARCQRTLHDLAASQANFHVLDFVQEPTTLIAAASRVIAMAGYGTFTEVVSFEKPALLVPRITPRKEQLIRAQRFDELGLVDCLTPDRLTPSALTTWLRNETDAGRDARNRLDLGGNDHIPRMADALLRGDRVEGALTGCALTPPPTAEREADGPRRNPLWRQ